MTAWVGIEKTPIKTYVACDKAEMAEMAKVTLGWMFDTFMSLNIFNIFSYYFFFRSQ